MALLLAPNLISLLAASDNTTSASTLIVTPMLTFALFFAIMGNWPWLACLLLLPFATLAPLDAYYVARYHNEPTPAVIASIFATNPREIREYLGSALIPLALSAIAGAALSLLAAWSSWRARLRWRNRLQSMLVAITIVVPTTAIVLAAAAGGGDAGTRMKRVSDATSALATPMQRGYPVSLIAQYVVYRRQIGHLRDDIAELSAFRFHARRRSISTHDRQIYVLVIGESSRRDHWQLFGYDRKTNPELTQIPNIIPIRNMVTSWPESIAAVPMLITRRPPDGNPLTWKEASVMRAMDETGYDTWWISNQMPIGIFDSMVSTYAYEAKHVIFINHVSWTSAGSYDEDILKPLRRALTASNHDMFIVLHLMGSHLRYDYRYPDAFRRFRPTESDPPDRTSTFERTRNSYDNTIVYTDHVLARIIDTLRGSDAITAMWYSSDHGEALPTPPCPIVGHGYGTRFEYEIPVFFWASDAFVKAYPDKMAALKVNATSATVAADTFDSLVDAANVTYPSQSPARSLFSTAWRYRPRIVNYPVKVDIDKAAFDVNCRVVASPRP